MRQNKTLSEEKPLASLQSVEEQAQLVDRQEIERRCSNFFKFVDETTLKARSVNMRKYKAVMGSSYQEVVSIEEIHDVVRSIAKRYVMDQVRLLTSGASWKQWSRTDTLLLLWIVEKYKVLSKKIPEEYNRDDWVRLSRLLPGKSSNQCMFKWLSLFKNPLQKNPWTADENAILKRLVGEQTEVDWQTVSQRLFLSVGSDATYRTAKQCKEHYSYHLDPNLRKGHWTEEEDIQLLRLHLAEGKRWQKIASLMNGRTENSVKNRISSIMERYVLPLLEPDTPIKDKINQYLKRVEGRKPEPPTQTSITPHTETALLIENSAPTAFIIPPTITSISLSTTPLAQQQETARTEGVIPQIVENLDGASSTQVRLQDEYFNTHATVNERRNVRYVTFMQMSVEQLLKEENILSAIFYTDTNTILHKEISLVERKGTFDDRDFLVDLINYGE